MIRTACFASATSAAATAPTASTAAIALALRLVSGTAGFELTAFLRRTIIVISRAIRVGLTLSPILVEGITATLGRFVGAVASAFCTCVSRTGIGRARFTGSGLVAATAAAAPTAAATTASTALARFVTGSLRSVATVESIVSRGLVSRNTFIGGGIGGLVREVVVTGLVAWRRLVARVGLVGALRRFTGLSGDVHRHAIGTAAAATATTATTTAATPPSLVRFAVHRRSAGLGGRCFVGVTVGRRLISVARGVGSVAPKIVG